MILACGLINCWVMTDWLKNEQESNFRLNNIFWRIQNIFTGTLHLKSRARQREIYFPKYIHIFLLYIERWMGMNCPNLGKIIKRWWSDNFTRLSEIIHKVVQMLRAYIFWTKQIIEILLVRIMDASGWIFSRSAR